MSENSTPRICLLAETFHPVVGGGETHARLLARSLNSRGMGVFVLTRRSESGLPRREIVDCTPVHRIPPSGMRRLGKYAMAPLALFALLRRRRDYDMIFVCGFRVLGLPAVIAAKLLGRACVLRAEAQGEMSGEYASAHGRLSWAADALFRLWINLRNAVLKRADAFVAINRPIATEFARCGANISRIYEIPNGVDTRQFRPADAETRRLLRGKLGLPAKGAIAVYSGKLNRGKGLEYLLRAWETVAASSEDARLVLVGSGAGQSLSCEDDLRRQVCERGLDSRVTFTGCVRNVHEYLQASDIFILPSEYEGLPMSVLEAMSSGLPVIASAVGGIPEVVRHLETGILVKPRDSEGLAREIIGLIDSPAHLSRAGRLAVRERYSIEAVSARYCELFSSLQARMRG